MFYEDFSFVHFSLITIVLLLLLWKLSIDKKLSSRLEKQSSNAVGSAEQNEGHRQVELLSKLILILILTVSLLP